MPKSTKIFRIGRLKPENIRVEGQPFYWETISSNGKLLSRSEEEYARRDKSGVRKAIAALRKRIIETQHLPLEAVIEDLSNREGGK